MIEHTVPAGIAKDDKAAPTLTTVFDNDYPLLIPTLLSISEAIKNNVSRLSPCSFVHFYCLPPTDDSTQLVHKFFAI